MKTINLKHRLLSLLVVLAILVCTLPLTTIAAFAADEVPECEHLDEVTNGACDVCGELVYDDAGSIAEGEIMSLVLTSKSNGYKRVGFTPEVSGLYMIKAISTERDPLIFVYDSEANLIDNSDDWRNTRLFYLEVELVAGEEYSLLVADYYGNYSTTFTVKKICDEHTFVGDATCLGTWCSVCESYYGETGEHTPDGDATCVGTFCSVCESYYGDVDPDNHTDDVSDAFCDDCNNFDFTNMRVVTAFEDITVYLAEGSQETYFKFIPEVSGEYTFASKNSVHDPYVFLYNSDMERLSQNDDGGGDLEFRLTTGLIAGKTYVIGVYERTSDVELTFTITFVCDEHTYDGEATCTGTYCSVCQGYYGETDESNHVPEGDATCIGSACSICGEYYGDADPNNHADDENAICTACYKYNLDAMPEVFVFVDNTFGLGLYHTYTYLKFTPEVSGKYTFASKNSVDDPLIFIYDINGTTIGSDDDDGDSLEFLLTCDLVAGGTYVIGVYERTSDVDLTFTVTFACNEHTYDGEVTCVGTYCSVCRGYYGEANDNHTPDGDATCLGTWCSACEEFYGEAGDHRPYGDVTCLGTWCYLCESYYGETGEHTLEGDATCLGTFCSVCESYYGETGEHTPDGDATCLGTFCSVCNTYYGDKTDHIPDETSNCLGTECAFCDGYFGEPAYDHVDENDDNLCDICEFVCDCPEIGAVGDHSVYLLEGIDTYYKFIPSVSGGYLFRSDSSYDPRLEIYDKNGNYMAGSDDAFELNFYFEVTLVAGETYYLCFYEYNDDNYCPVSIRLLCEVHTPAGEAVCLGTLCSVCGVYYGDAGDHKYDEIHYDTEFHWIECDVCRTVVEGYHAYDDNGDCECGYFIHECVIDAYDYTTSEHRMVCSLCGIADDDTIDYHEYDEEGVCICGRERFTDGILIGEILLSDGQYLDNDGNLSDTEPEGGYAYYKDGVLTLNNFELEVTEENTFGEPTAIYTEIDLTIILIGESELTTYGEDGITVRFADLTISGDGTLKIRAEELYDDYYGDGIDLTYGSLVINGGKLDIYGSDHGIEIDYGDMTVNGGEIYIEADDEGIDITGGDLTVNDGILDIYADDKGIDVGGNLTINGGIVDVYSHDDGIEVSEDLVIDGGVIDIYSENNGIEVTGELITDNAEVDIFAAQTGILVDGNVTLGGSFRIEATYGGIVSFSDILLGDVVFSIDLEEDVYAITGISINVEGEQGDIVIVEIVDAELSYSYINDGRFGVGDYVGKALIDYGYISIVDGYAYSGEEISVDIYSELQLGVDYLVELPEGGIKEVGTYKVKIIGIGDYVGELEVTIAVHNNIEITLDESVDMTATAIYDDVWTLISFTPEYDGTYELNALGGADHYYIDMLMGMTDRVNLFSSSENASLILELKAGVTYYFDIYSEHGGVSLEISIGVICEDHFGGEATYHEQAVCDRCGEHYGELLLCDPHVGGTATYHEHAVCVNCGKEYGDLLVCDHMCHKGGIKGLVWKVFTKIYDYFGIEMDDCKCGDEH